MCSRRFCGLGLATNPSQTAGAGCPRILSKYPLPILPVKIIITLSFGADKLTPQAAVLGWMVYDAQPLLAARSSRKKCPPLWVITPIGQPGPRAGGLLAEGIARYRLRVFGLFVMISKGSAIGVMYLLQ